MKKWFILTAAIPTIGIFSLFSVNISPRSSITSVIGLESPTTPTNIPTPTDTPTPTLIPTFTPTPTNTPSPTPEPKKLEPTPTIVSENKLKACFTYYGDSVDGDIYYYGKEITFDASCSKGAEKYIWNNQTNNFSQESLGKVWSKCLRCDSNQSWRWGGEEQETVVKLTIIDKDGNEDTQTKVIKFKTRK